jgi:hypothetical protein
MRLHWKRFNLLGFINGYVATDKKVIVHNISPMKHLP